MAQPIEIRNYGDNYVGSVTFDESPRRLHAERTADGFRLQLPTTISFKKVPKGEPLPLVGNFRGLIYAGEDSGPKIQVGEMRMEDWHVGGFYERPEHAGVYEQTSYMVWSGSLAQLAVYEKIRDGRQPKLEVRFTGEFCVLLRTQHEYYSARSEPHSFHHRHGNLLLSYPKETWVEMLRGLRVAENVLVEVPLPGSPTPDWDEVWRGLVDARNAFEQGGSTGWKGCVTGVRLSLEKWQKLEPEDKGPGWVSPSVTDRQARTKKQRLDNLRWHLLQIAHLGAHTGAEDWTRDDALLMLSTLSVLLSERKP